MSEMNYLSDEELSKLISDVEEKELVNAPPSLCKDVLKEIDRRNEVVLFTKKKLIRFRVQVIATMAAVIALVFVGPWMKQVMKTREHSKMHTWQEREAAEEKDTLFKIERNGEKKNGGMFVDFGSASSIFTENEVFNIFGHGGSNNEEEQE